MRIVFDAPKKRVTQTGRYTCAYSVHSRKALETAEKGIGRILVPRTRRKGMEKLEDPNLFNRPNKRRLAGLCGTQNQLHIPPIFTSSNGTGDEADSSNVSSARVA